ncbi:hypothetical protein HDV05_002088 [Chytridiales sp. JEL 0842]|nr:hypothetical protein HDV05_002088 [Chytridiales sp. JEL 0842]
MRLSSAFPLLALLASTAATTSRQKVREAESVATSNTHRLNKPFRMPSVLVDQAKQEADAFNIVADDSDVFTITVSKSANEKKQKHHKVSKPKNRGAWLKNIKKNVQKSAEPLLVTSQVASDQDGATPWTVYEHKGFEGYRIRTRTDVKLCDPNVKQITGYLDVVGEDKNFFFWFFESRSKPATDPLILWLNGGPGCSSLTGLFMELGPCWAAPGGNGTTHNKYSWNSNANIIFLDQPTDVGFSYSDSGNGVSTTTDAAADVYAFLQLFLTAYPKYSELDFHITGESYAGHYIPAIASAVVDGNYDVENPDNDGTTIKINLSSVAIGNGLTDPAVQYEYYPKFACENNYGPVLDQTECDQMASKYSFCKNLIEACYNYQNAFTCVPGAVYCNAAMISPFQKTGLNIYDIRKKCDSSNPLCYSILSDIETYLNRPEIQKTLGVDRNYKGCNTDVNIKFMMAGDWMRPYVKLVPELLEEGIKVLIYAGDADYICNWMGNEAWVKELDWPGNEGFNDADLLSWTSRITGKKAGEFRTYENLTWLRIFEAGHMVPYDQPEHSNEFINMWISPKGLLA